MSIFLTSLRHADAVPPKVCADPSGHSRLSEIAKLGLKMDAT